VIAGGDNRRAEQPICCNANEQEDRDHDRRNEVFHGFLRKVNPIGGPASDYNTAQRATAARARQASTITTSKYFFSVAPACSRLGVLGSLRRGKSSTNRWLMARLSEGCGRSMGDRNQSRECLRRDGLRQICKPGGLLPRVHPKPRQRRDDIERHSILLISDRRE